MPSYEYECRACGHSFERTQSMSDEPIKVCPECGKDVRRVIFGGSGVIFRGSGFYVNDAKGKNATLKASEGEKKASEAPAAPAPSPAPAKTGTKESA